MLARTGADYMAGLQESPPTIFMPGEAVKDVTTYPGLRNGMQALTRLCDVQLDRALLDAMTYDSPTADYRVGLSFIEPHFHDELDTGFLGRHVRSCHLTFIY